ncbi:MAG: hypothetical protein QNJ09_04270 [Paracoccaceae bacterium]|nr:hypothetical protein [Paracoccaceae bacterium]
MFVSSDQKRRKRVMQAARIAQAASHPADWTQRSDLSAITLEEREGGEPLRLLRDEAVTVLGWNIYDRTQTYTMTASESPKSKEHDDQLVSAALLVPPWPKANSDDIRSFELAAANIMELSGSRLLSCSIAVDGALTYLNGVVPPVDALHAWTRLAEDPNLIQTNDPVEAGQQKWNEAFVDIDTAWGQRLSSLVTRLKAVRVFSEIIPVDLSPSENGDAPAFNLSHLLARLTDPQKQARARGTRAAFLSSLLKSGSP